MLSNFQHLPIFLKFLKTKIITLTPCLNQNLQSVHGINVHMIKETGREESLYFLKFNLNLERWSYFE